jgi:8-oxo-dGTP pyrophosphatase MutT (NUDIX family)
MVLKSEFANIKTSLKEALNSELPGERAHLLMLPLGRKLYPGENKSGVIQSSVLILLFPNKGKINTCLIRRPMKMRNHGGQFAFPGGRFEASDKDLFETALRELFEEIGTDRNQLEIIGGLTPLYIQVSNFIINPVIAWRETMPDFKIDSQEVDELFIIPIEKFSNHTSSQLREVLTISGTLEVPGYYIDQLFIWGATAMIIAEFNEIFKQALIVKSP